MVPTAELQYNFLGAFRAALGPVGCLNLQLGLQQYISLRLRASSYPFRHTSLFCLLREEGWSAVDDDSRWPPPWARTEGLLGPSGRRCGSEAHHPRATLSALPGTAPLTDERRDVTVVFRVG